MSRRGSRRGVDVEEATDVFGGRGCRRCLPTVARCGHVRLGNSETDAVMQLGASRVDAWMALVRQLDNASAEVRREAASHLRGEMHRPEVRQALLAAVKDEDSQVRSTALYQIGA